MSPDEDISENPTTTILYGLLGELRHASQGFPSILPDKYILGILMFLARKRSPKLTVSSTDVFRMVERAVHFIRVSSAHSSLTILGMEKKQVWPGEMDEEKLVAAIYFGLLGATYTQQAGSSLRLGMTYEQKFTLKIEFSGEAIPMAYLENLLSGEYQVSESKLTPSRLGQTLCWAFCKALIQLHQGELNIFQKMDQATLELVIPLKPTGTESGRKRAPESEEAFLFQLPISDTSIGDKAELILPRENWPSVLLIEEDVLTRSMVNEHLGNRYHLLEVSNWEKGIQLALSIMPELIIGAYDHHEASTINKHCKELKQDPRTSHIPLILLYDLLYTQAENLEGLADDFLPRPLNSRLLRLRTRNLILSREYLRNRFQKFFPLRDTELSLPLIDETFLERAMGIVEERLADPNLSVESLGKEMGMSRSHFHRKIKSLTNYTPSEFIRNIRLRYAVELLLQQKYSITEITYRVGFNSPSYFTTSFRKYFGESPRDFLEKYLSPSSFEKPS